ncbi:hypothetical protein C3747_7g318 [Trypanosoma cruzi]|uniref:Temperature dependent protein affecting M2 dsRNA replication n=1 Tax=Trypanosoma cruzi TaxID=5693 RepID=A0A2V2XID1_TRYCR|nr:hypothetical protein C3747_7g318 [Trypanosoma cruzi]
MRKMGGNRNNERQGRGQGQQGSPMAPPVSSMGYQQHQHQHHQYHHHHHHQHHHNSSYSNVYEGSRPPPHSMQQMSPHGYGPGGGGGAPAAAGGNGWNPPQQQQQQMPMYNQGYGHMGPGAGGGSGGGYGDMGGVYQDMHPGQYPPSPSPSHMGGGSGMPYMRNPPMHGGVPPAGPIPGPYGGLPGQGAPLPPMGYGRGGHPPMDPMQQGGMYGGPMVRHDGYPDNRISPPPQVGYGPNVGAPPPPPPGIPYGGGNPMPVARSPAGVPTAAGGYPDPRSKGMLNNPMPMLNAPRHPRVGTPEPGIMGGGIPPGRFNHQSALAPPGMLPPANYMPVGSVPPNQPPIMPAPASPGDPLHVERFSLGGPTENLYDFLYEHDLVSVDNLSSFFPEGYDPKRDPPLKIAVDGNFCLNSLRDELRKRDPLWFLHSTLPEELLDSVCHHVEWMRSLNLEPIWVFNGLSVSGDVETFLTSEGELRARDIVWSRLEEGEIPDEADIQTAFDQPLGEDVQMAVSRYLKKELNVMAVTAPFLNWAQMVAFHKEGLADLLMGPPEVLLLPYDNMKLIVQIDVSNSNVSYFDRERVLRVLFPYHVTETSTRGAGDRLMDLGLITATHPALSSTSVGLNLTMEEVYEELSSETPKFRSIKDFINAHAYVQDANKKKAGLIIKHSKGRGYLRYSGVFSSKLQDSPLVYLIRVLEPGLTNADMPTNLIGVLGNLVPLSLFYLQFVGLLSVRIMTVITQSYIRDECPVSDTKDYHEKLEVLMTMRSQIIAQVFKKISKDRHPNNTECLSWVRWFKPILAPMQRPRDLINLDEWDISSSEEVLQLDEEHLERYSIASVLTFSAEAARPIRDQNICSPRETPIRYHGKRETFFTVLLKAFDFLGYFSHSTVSPEMGEDGEMMAGGVEEGVEAVGQGNNAEGAPILTSDSNSNNYNELHDSLPEEGISEYPTVYFPTYLMNAIKHNPRSFQNAFVVLTEILRVGIIGSLPCRYIDPADPQLAISMENQESNCDPRVLLASRIGCLINLPYRRETEDLPFIWAPVYSRHLCAFTVMVRAMCRCLRELVEVIATTVFLAGNSSCSLVDFSSFAFLLPFGEIPSAIGGLLLHYVLVFPSDYQVNLTTRQERLEYLQEKFRDIPDLAVHLRMVMTFTLQALYLINAYKVSDKGTVVPQHLLEDNTVECTIQLLWEKWYDHIDDDPPQDIHGLYGDSMIGMERGPAGG